MILSFFLNPFAFWWAILLPLIVLLYFLKLKRDKYVFPSTMLWQHILEDMRVNSPFQKLKSNLLLFFQLLLVLLLVVALARPYLAGENKGARKIVLLLDNSASMKAIDEASTRMEKAKALALTLAQDLVEGDSMMVISFAENAIIAQPFTGLKSLLKERIQAIVPYDEESKIGDAFVLAQTMLQKVSAPLLYVITDGAIQDLDKILASYENKALAQTKELVVPKFMLVGTKAGNVAILGFDIRSDKEGQHEAFVRLQNLGDKPAKGYVELSQDEQVWEEGIQLVELGPGDGTGLLFPKIPMTQGRIEAHWRLTAGEDFFPLDDKAYFSLVKPQKPQIALVTKGNFFLQKVLTAYESSIRVMDLKRYREEAGNFDVVVFDNCAPEKELPRGSYLFIHALPSLPDLRREGTLQGREGRALQILDQNDFHPSMRFVDMRHLALSKALRISWPIDALALLEAENEAVMACFSRAGRTYMVVAFDLLESDWPLRLSFPIFIANTIQWFLEKQSMVNLRVGESFSLRIPPDTAAPTVLTPSGASYPLLSHPEEGFLFSKTQHAGFYRVSLGKEKEFTFAANLFSQPESTIQGQSTISLKEKEIATQWEPITNEIWRLIALLAFFVLLAEWYLYHRRSFTWAKKRVAKRSLS